MKLVTLYGGITFLVGGLFLTIGYIFLKMPWFTILFSLFFVVMGARMLAIALKRLALEKKLRENGKKVWATITGTSPNYSVTIKGRHPSIIHCEYNGVHYYGEYPRTITRDIGGEIIPVYVSEENPKQYVMDMSALN